MEREMREVLHEQVDKRNRELATYAMEKAALAESRQALAREAARAATDNDADLRNILNQLSRRLGESDSEAVTKDFRIYFERVHPRFADNLKQKHPQITNNDLRLCIFLYLGMSTKEIAALLSRESAVWKPPACACARNWGCPRALPSRTTWPQFDCPAETRKKRGARALQAPLSKVCLSV